MTAITAVVAFPEMGHHNSTPSLHKHTVLVFSGDAMLAWIEEVAALPDDEVRARLLAPQPEWADHYGWQGPASRHSSTPLTRSTALRGRYASTGVTLLKMAAQRA